MQPVTFAPYLANFRLPRPWGWTAKCLTDCRLTARPPWLCAIRVKHISYKTFMFLSSQPKCPRQDGYEDTRPCRACVLCCAVPQKCKLAAVFPHPNWIQFGYLRPCTGVIQVQVVPDSREHSLMCVHQSTSKACSPSGWYIRTKSGKRGLTQPSNLTAKQILLGKSKCLITWVAQE